MPAPASRPHARGRAGQAPPLGRATRSAAPPVTARLATHVWVAAYLTRLRLADIPAFVVARGDPTAGAVLVKLNTLDGRARLYQRSFDLMSGARAWIVLAEGEEPAVDASIAKQRSFDRDLWVIEVEDRAGRHLLDEDGLSD